MEEEGLGCVGSGAPAWSMLSRSCRVCFRLLGPFCKNCIELVVDSHSAVKNNTENSLDTLPSFLQRYHFARLWYNITTKILKLIEFSDLTQISLVLLLMVFMVRIHNHILNAYVVKYFYYLITFSQFE